MPRAGVTVAFATAMAARVIRPCFLVQLQFKTDVLNLWSGTYPVIFGGATFEGAGSLMTISGISEDSTVEAKNVTITVSGIPSEIINDALNETQRGLKAQVYLGLFEQDGVTLVPDPVLAYTGRIDQPSITDSGDTCTIAINIENALADMNRPVDRRYTDADQQHDHPGDLGCSFIAAIQNIQIYFGSLPSNVNNV
jgi:hypothetical protein